MIFQTQMSSLASDDPSGHIECLTLGDAQYQSLHLAYPSASELFLGFACAKCLIQAQSYASAGLKHYPASMS